MEDHMTQQEKAIRECWDVIAPNFLNTLEDVAKLFTYSDDTAIGWQIRELYKFVPFIIAHPSGNAYYLIAGSFIEIDKPFPEGWKKLFPNWRHAHETGTESRYHYILTEIPTNFNVENTTQLLEDTLALFHPEWKFDDGRISFEGTPEQQAQQSEDTCGAIGTAIDLIEQAAQFIEKNKDLFDPSIFMFGDSEDFTTLFWGADDISIVAINNRLRQTGFDWEPEIDDEGTISVRKTIQNPIDDWDSFAQKVWDEIKKRHPYWCYQLLEDTVADFIATI